MRSLRNAQKSKRQTRRRKKLEIANEHFQKVGTIAGPGILGAIVYYFRRKKEKREELNERLARMEAKTDAIEKNVQIMLTHIVSTKARRRK